MLQALIAAVSGLDVHQQWMDLIGNDIANVDTIGFKSQNMDFASLFAQTTSQGNAPTATSGGTNPIQIGLGATVGSVSTDESNGALQETNIATNVALQGSGMFVLNNGSGGDVYTRMGDFSTDSSGYLVEGTSGDRVEGWMATNGVLPQENSSTLQDITLPNTQVLPPQATSSVTYSGNLDVAATSSVTAPITVYDSLGNTWTLNFTFSPSGTSDVWNWQATVPAGAGGGTFNGTITFKSNGTFQSMTGGPITMNPTGAAAQTITPNFSAVTQLNETTSVSGSNQNGTSAGTLSSLSVSNTGVITGSFSNGQTQTLAQVAVASFANPQGLVQTGDGVYSVGNNSGLAQIGVAGVGGRGTMDSGYLEGSNVNLALELTEMMDAERGFQANTQVVTTVLQMLQSLSTL